MGFVRSRIVKITWDDDSDLHGLEIRSRAVSVEKYLEFQEYADQIDAGDMDAVRKMLAMFAEVLVSWNLENQNEEDKPPVPVPATLDGIYKQDLPFVLEICLKWLDAMTGVGADLGKESTSGVQFPEGSIPMDVSSIDLEQLIAQNSS